MMTSAGNSTTNFSDFIFIIILITYKYCKYIVEFYNYVRRLNYLDHVAHRFRGVTVHVPEGCCKSNLLTIVSSRILVVNG